MKRFLLPLLLSACGFIFLGAQPAKANYRICNKTGKIIQINTTFRVRSHRSDNTLLGYNNYHPNGSNGPRKVYGGRMIGKGECVKSLEVEGREANYSGAGIIVFGHPTSLKVMRKQSTSYLHACRVLRRYYTSKKVLGGVVYDTFVISSASDGFYIGSIGDGTADSSSPKSCKDLGGGYYNFYPLPDTHWPKQGKEYWSNLNTHMSVGQYMTDHYRRFCELDIEPKRFVSNCQPWYYWFEGK